jgi:hypothetical protein
MVPLADRGGMRSLHLERRRRTPNSLKRSASTSHMNQNKSHVTLFGTTLRAGEQSLSALTNLRKTSRLADFRIAVNRSFEALRKITTIVTTLSRGCAFDGAQSAARVSGALATANVNKLLLKREKSISALSA